MDITSRRVVGVPFTDVDFLWVSRPQGSLKKVDPYLEMDSPSFSPMRRGEGDSPPAFAMTADLSASIMEEAGYNKKHYFQLLNRLRQRGNSTANRKPKPREDAEAHIPSHCFRHNGPFFVFGDSTAREAAIRIAKLRGVNCTQSMRIACRTGDVSRVWDPNPNIQACHTRGVDAQVGVFWPD